MVERREEVWLKRGKEVWLNGGREQRIHGYELWLRWWVHMSIMTN